MTSKLHVTVRQKRRGFRTRRTVSCAVMRAAVGFATFVLGATGIASAASCGGDCNGDGQVLVDELVRGITVVLGNAPLSECRAFDQNGDQAVTVDELLTGVGNALDGCPTAERLAFVITTDFQTGSFATVSLAEPRGVEPASAARSVNSDAVARAFGGLVYVVNRFGADNIQVLDPSRNFSTRLQCSTGNGSNPSDVAFVSRSKAYVARYARSRLLIINPSARPDCSDFELGTIDLSAFADADGVPEMAQLAVVGDRLYVSVQRLQNFAPAMRGAILVVDTATDQVVSEITLSGENPFAQTKGLTAIDGAIVVAEAGNFGVQDGGIERVDLASHSAQGFFITEEELGGDVTDFALISERLGYALLSRADFTNSIVAFDPTARTVTSTLLAGGSYSDLEANDRNELFVADRTITRPGLRVFRASDGVELTPAALDLVLPPFDILFLR